MLESILKMTAAVIGYFTARGIDKIIGKWYAHFQILWESTIIKGYMEGYREGMDEIRKNSPEKFVQWKNWRDSLKQGKI